MKNITITASISGFISVALGAFGAHGLKKILSPEMLQTFQTGVQYQFYHSFALLAVALLMMHHSSKFLNYAAILFIAGIILFSGSLYFLSISGIKALGIITPFGGICFLGGWIALSVFAFKLKKP